MRTPEDSIWRESRRLGDRHPDATTGDLPGVRYWATSVTQRSDCTVSIPLNQWPGEPHSEARVAIQCATERVAHARARTDANVRHHRVRPEARGQRVCVCGRIERGELLGRERGNEHVGHRRGRAELREATRGVPEGWSVEPAAVWAMASERRSRAGDESSAGI